MYPPAYTHTHTHKYTHTHKREGGGERERERERETCHICIRPATAAPHPGPGTVCITGPATSTPATVSTVKPSYRLSKSDPAGSCGAGPTLEASEELAASGVGVREVCVAGCCWVLLGVC